FGHGLTLSVRKVDLLGVDTTVRGGRLDYAGGALGVTLLGGWLNPQNTDPIELKTFADPGDWMAGAEVREKLSETLRLSQSALYLRTVGASPTGTDVETAMAGAAADVRREHLRGAFEVVGLAQSGAAASSAAVPGFGAYA